MRHGRLRELASIQNGVYCVALWQGLERLETMSNQRQQTLFRILALVAFLNIILTGRGTPAQTRATMSPIFSPVDISANLQTLADNERQALAKILDAARVMDGIFLEQVWAGNPALLMDLVGDASARGRARLNFFMINKGPWSRLQKNQSFIPNVPPKPAGANYYPPDATRAEVASWIDSLLPTARAKATGFFTTIRRGPNRQLRTVPYSVEYQGPLATAAAHLRAAARLTKQPTLAHYLATRADAFLTNDYYESDVAWMELDASIEPTIGPYEVYEDKWFNYKAAFEAFVTIRDDAETAKLEQFGSILQELENHLPIDARYRNPNLGTMAPIRVVNAIFTAGDANSGVQAAAFNLPNDERVVREKGSKRVMLKNVQEAKFNLVLLPISSVALPNLARDDVSFEAFFIHILMHELMHGLGPHTITVDGRETTVRQELREAYSPIEEAKADISGLWALRYLIHSGLVDRSLQRQIYTTFVASILRSIRFGVDEAHSRGVAIQLNKFLDHGAVTVSNGFFSVDHERMPAVVEALTGELMTIQARGDYEDATLMLETLGVVRPEVQEVLERLSSVPVDIEPHYSTAESLRGIR